MANDSALFWTQDLLEEAGAYPTKLGRWKKGDQQWAPLYEGKMIDFFDHRFAEVDVDENRTFRPGQPSKIGEAEKQDPNFVVPGRYFISESEIPLYHSGWVIAFKDVSSATNHRTMVSSICPYVAFNHKAPIWTFPDQVIGIREGPLFQGNLASFAFDSIVRTKSNSNSLVLFMLEQIPVVPPAAYSRAFGPKTAAEIVKDHVLRLTYTAFDMRPFARDMGFEGEPFRWDEDERRHLRARLDALYFHLYGIADEADIRYILSTFPIVERKDRAAHEGVYLTAELIIWYFRALAAGDPDGQAPEAALIRAARLRPGAPAGTRTKAS